MKKMLLAIVVLSGTCLALGVETDTASDFEASLAQFDQVELSHLPTPLEELKTLRGSLIKNKLLSSMWSPLLQK